MVVSKGGWGFFFEEFVKDLDSEEEFLVKFKVVVVVVFRLVKVVFVLVVKLKVVVVVKMVFKEIEKDIIWVEVVVKLIKVIKFVVKWLCDVDEDDSLSLGMLFSKCVKVGSKVFIMGVNLMKLWIVLDVS